MDIPLADNFGYVDQKSICDVAQAFVEENHPEACASILGGSAAAGTATSTSDLDIALLYPNGHSNYAQTTRYRGWLVETFVHTPESLQFWYRKEAQDRRPVIAALCASGLLLTDDGSGAAWQAGAQAEIARGPEPGTTASKTFKSPADALTWQESIKGKTFVVPVYDSTGKTVVGEFVISAGGETSGIAGEPAAECIGIPATLGPGEAWPCPRLSSVETGYPAKPVPSN